MAGFPYSTSVQAGTDATAAEYNNSRKDALTRWLKFEVLGNLAVGNTQGGSFVMPFAGQVIQTYTKLDSGSATIRLVNNTQSQNIEGAIGVSSTYSVDTNPILPNVSKGDLITMDVTAQTNAVHLIVEVEVLCTP